MKVCFLGTAGAESTAVRNNSCFIITGGTGTLPVLIDANGNIIQRLKQAGVDYSLLKHINVTHHHPDHIIGIPSLLQEMWLYNLYRGLPKREDPIYIYGGTETVEFLKKMLDLLGLNETHKFLFPVVFVDIEKQGLKAQIGDLDFSFIRVSHGDMPCFGFRVKEPGETHGLVYSGDTQPIDAVFNACAPQDTIIHECASFVKHTPPMFNHTDITQIEDNIPNISAKRIILTHMYFKDEETEKSQNTRLTEKYSGRVIIARDLQSFEV